jgi:hypothetical protein
MTGRVASLCIAALMMLAVMPPARGAEDPAWTAYRDAIMAFADEMTAMQAEAAVASREERSAIYGEMLARSIDHAAWAVSTPWEGCFAAFADSYWRWSQLWAIGAAALYQQSAAIEGDPVSAEALGVLSTMYEFRSSVTQGLLDGVTC